jgi:putative ABC transport system permease protein
MSIFDRTPLAWLNLIHNRSRLFTSLASVTFAVILMLMFTGFKNALYDSQVYLLEKMNADLVLTSSLRTRLSSPETFKLTRLYQAQNLGGIEAAYPLYMQLADWKNPQTKRNRSVRVLAFNPSHSAFQLPEVEAKAAQLHRLETMLLDRKSRPEVGMPEIGQATELAQQMVQMVGAFTLGTDFSSADGNVIVGDRTFFELFGQFRPGQWNEVDVGLLQTNSTANIPELVRALQQYLPSDVVILTKEAFIQKEKEYWQKNTSIGFVFTLLTSMGFVVGIVLVYQILYTDIADHWAEYATLKAMGYTNHYLLTVIAQEAILLSLMGFVPGYCMSAILYHLTANTTGLMFELTIERAISQLVITLVMCLASGMIAVRKVQAADPAEMFG